MIYLSSSTEIDFHKVFITCLYNVSKLRNEVAI